MTEETRSYNAITNENIMLHEQLEQLRLKQAKGRTQTYQTPGSEVEVDIEFGRFMYEAGFHKAMADSMFHYNHSQRVSAKSCVAAIEAWQARQPDSPTIDNDSD